MGDRDDAVHRELDHRPAGHDPVRVVEASGVSWRQRGRRSWVADLGSVIAGWCRYELLTDGPITVTATHGERLRADGSVDNDTTTSTSPRRRSIMSASTSTTGAFEPRFSYKGFRYVQVEGSTTCPGSCD